MPAAGYLETSPPADDSTEINLPSELLSFIAARLFELGEFGELGQRASLNEGRGQGHETSFSSLFQLNSTVVPCLKKAPNYEQPCFNNNKGPRNANVVLEGFLLGLGNEQQQQPTKPAPRFVLRLYPDSNNYYANSETINSGGEEQEPMTNLASPSTPRSPSQRLVSLSRSASQARLAAHPANEPIVLDFLFKADPGLAPRCLLHGLDGDHGAKNNWSVLEYIDNAGPLAAGEIRQCEVSEVAASLLGRTHHALEKGLKMGLKKPRLRKVVDDWEVVPSSLEADFLGLLGSETIAGACTPGAMTNGHAHNNGHSMNANGSISTDTIDAAAAAAVNDLCSDCALAPELSHRLGTLWTRLQSVSLSHATDFRSLPRDVIVHGDAQCGNLLRDASGSDQLYLVDWEDAHLGNPLEDLGSMLAIAVPPFDSKSEAEFIDAYLAEVHDALRERIGKLRVAGKFAEELNLYKARKLCKVIAGLNAGLVRSVGMGVGEGGGAVDLETRKCEVVASVRYFAGQLEKVLDAIEGINKPKAAK